MQSRWRLLKSKKSRAGNGGTQTTLPALWDRQRARLLVGLPETVIDLVSPEPGQRQATPVPEPGQRQANPVPGPELSAGVVNSDGGASVEPPAAAAVDDPADMAAAAAAVGDPAAMAAAAAAVGNPASMAAAALEVRSTWDTSQQACLIAAVTECGEEPKMFQRIARRHGCDLGRRKAVSGCRWMYIGIGLLSGVSSMSLCMFTKQCTPRSQLNA